MVGTLEQKKEIYALVKSAGQQAVPRQHGNYLGQNFGRIIAISESVDQAEGTGSGQRRQLGRREEQVAAAAGRIRGG